MLYLKVDDYPNFRGLIDILLLISIGLYALIAFAYIKTSSIEKDKSTLKEMLK